MYIAVERMVQLWKTEKIRAITEKAVKKTADRNTGRKVPC